MVNRRRFLTLSSLAGLLPSLSFTFSKPASRPVADDTGDLLATGPMIISTWKQPKANAAAQAAFDKGGSALDAVEAGVDLP